MTGPEHYREAEKILAHVSTKAEIVPETRDSMIAAAQVHATLALAAASALSMGAEARRSVHLSWAAVIGEVSS